MSRSLYLSLLLLSTSVALAQLSTAPASLGGVPEVEAKSEQFFIDNSEQLQAHPASTWQLDAASAKNILTDKQHLRYRQSINGWPVIGGTLILHTDKTGNVLRYTGDSYTDQPLAQQALVDLERATRRVHRVLPKAELVEARLVYVDRLYPVVSGYLRLAYELEMLDEQAQNRELVYVDALTSQVLARTPLVMHATVPGTGESTYYGNVTFDVEQVSASHYELRDDLRGLEVTSVTSSGIPVSPSPHFTASNYGRAMAVDVFYGMNRFYDLLLDRFGWAGVDGNGEEFQATVDDGEHSFVNAYWNGTIARFGGGDCHYQPLTTLDVVGHEFAHGITQRTSNLIYRGESGALNEGFSDIYGKALELIEQPDQFTWDLGNRFAASPYARKFRSMEDPTRHGNPRVYQGDLWHDGAGVHTNSGPLGHWFYLLVEGGSGTNELGTSYNVLPIGVEDAFAIAFATNRNYLTEASTYTDAYQGSLLAAASLFGSSSPQYRNLEEAWAAIGLPASNPPQLTRDVSTNNFSSNASTTCHPEDSLVLTLILRNEGDVVPAGTVMQVLAEVNNTIGTINYTFADDLSVGGYLFEDLTFPMTLAAGEYSATLTVALPGDTNSQNDSGSQDVEVSDIATDATLALLEFANFSCSTDEVSTYVTLRNTGCGLLDQDYIINFYDQHDAILFTANGRLVAIQPGWEDDLHVFLDTDIAQYLVRAEVVLAGDGNSENNDLTISNKFTRPLRQNQQLDFESPYDTVAIVVDNYDSGVIGRIEYQGNHVFATTGGSYSTGRLPCLSPEENLSAQRYSLPPSTCFDLSGLADPILTFDMVQLHADGNTQFPELNDQARAVRVVWTGEDGSTGSSLIPSQPDELWTEQQISLPANFVGKVELEIFNLEGYGSFHKSGIDLSLEEYDYTLIDNFGVRASLGTGEPLVELRVAPNPASGYVELTFPAAVEQQLVVVSALGQVVHQATVRERHVLDVGQWPAGMYTLVLRDVAGIQARRQLVVVR